MTEAHLERPKLPLLKRAGFVLRGDNFGVENETRVESAQLFELFFPERLPRLQGRQATTKDAGRLFKKSFFTAQLRYYGIKFPSNATRYDLEKLLKESLLADKVTKQQSQNSGSILTMGMPYCKANTRLQCENVPAQVLELERSMRADYEPIHRAWEEAAASWDAEQLAKKDAAWARCSTPGERAELDLERFINHYFLTDGQPDPSKTEEPLALYGFQGRSQLHSKSGKIHGLETCSGGDGDTRTICVGWNRSAVWNLARQVGAESTLQETAKREARWDDSMKHHRALVKETGKTGPEVNPKSMIPAMLQKSRGSYIVRCDYIAEQWPHKEPLTLDIAPGPRHNVMQGAMNFSIYEGTMLLAVSETVLDDFVQEPGDSDDDDEAEADEGDSSRKRLPHRPTPTEKSARPSKKAKAEVPPRRVFVRVRGRETGEGEIQFEAQAGHLDFVDDTYTAFRGVVDLSAIGDGLSIEGFKVQARPKRRAEAWGNFSEAAWDHASTRRWH